MESTRQKKVSRQLLKDLSEILLLKGRDLIGTSLVSVTVVRISSDLSIARVYISVFGNEDKEALLTKINQQSYAIRKKILTCINPTSDQMIHHGSIDESVQTLIKY